MEEEEEGQPSLEQTATSVAAGEEEEGELGEGTVPTDEPSTSASTSQTKEEGGKREKCGIIGASLSEPHTSMTAFAEVVCMSACLLVAIYRKF